MVLTQSVLTDGQSAQEQRLGLGKLPLAAVEHREIVETVCGIGMLGATVLFSDGQSA
jgi:hypothetical protein